MANFMFGFFYEIFWKPSVIFIWLRAKFGSQRGQKGLKSLFLFCLNPIVLCMYGFLMKGIVLLWLALPWDLSLLRVVWLPSNYGFEDDRAASVSWQGPAVTTNVHLIITQRCSSQGPNVPYSYWLNKVKLPSYWSITGSKTICYICYKTCWTF